MQDVILNSRGTSLLANLGAELDHHTVRGIREKIDSELSRVRPSELILDFSAVTFMDTSGIGLILGRAEKCEAIGTAIRLRGLEGRIRRLVLMAGVERIKCVCIE